MHIDWFVFFAQIVNFLILVFLLKHFLYGRIIRAMDERQKRIAEGFDEVDQKRATLDAAIKEYDQKNVSLAEAYEERMKQVVADVGERRKAMLDQARREVAEIKIRWQETILHEKDAFIQELRQRAGRQVYAIAKRVLGDLADADVEEQIVDAFIRTMAKGEGQAVRDLFSETAGQGQVVVQSAFPLSSGSRDRLALALNQYAGRAVSATYETSEDILAGIELRTPGHKIAWSLNDYLEHLDESFTRALQEEARDQG